MGPADRTRNRHFPPVILDDLQLPCASPQNGLLLSLAEAVRKKNTKEIDDYFHRLEPLPKDNLEKASALFHLRTSIFENSTSLLPYTQTLESELYSILKDDPLLKRHIEVALTQYSDERSQYCFCKIFCDLALKKQDRDMFLLMCDIMNAHEICCPDINAYFPLFLTLCAESNKDGIASCFALMQRKKPYYYGYRYTSDLMKEAIEKPEKMPKVLVDLLNAVKITKNEEFLLACLVVVYESYEIRSQISACAEPNAYATIPQEAAADIMEMQPWVTEILLTRLQKPKTSEYDSSLDSLIFFLTHFIDKQPNRQHFETILDSIKSLPHEAQMQAILRLLQRHCERKHTKSFAALLAYIGKSSLKHDPNMRRALVLLLAEQGSRKLWFSTVAQHIALPSTLFQEYFATIPTSERSTISKLSHRLKGLSSDLHHDVDTCKTLCAEAKLSLLKLTGEI